MGFKNTDKKQTEIMPGCLRCGRSTDKFVGVFIGIVERKQNDLMSYDKGMILTTSAPNAIKIVPLDAHFGFTWWEELLR